jgi:hypothetical protein
MTEKKTLLALQFLCFALFSGRAWQAWFYQLPLEEVLWDEALVARPIAWLTGMDWETYTASEWSMYLEDRLCMAAGYGWALCALACLAVGRWPRILRWVLGAGCLSLVVLALLYTKEDFGRPAQFGEHAMQFALPLLLAMAATPALSGRWPRWAAIATAVTFAAHGCYAVGFYPRPGHWVQWCLNVFGMNEAGAEGWLLIMGVLDFVAAMLLLFFSFRKTLPDPWQKVYRLILAYCVLWGLLTALARLAGPAEYLAISGWEAFVRQNLHEVLVRLVHGGLPLVLWGRGFWEKNGGGNP